MRKSAVLLVTALAVIVLLLTIGCSSEESPTPTPTSTSTLEPTPVVTPQPTVAPTSTATATSTPVPTLQPDLKPPCRFHGEVELDGAPVPDGTVITATIEGNSYTTTTPAEAYGASSYAILISQPVGQSYTGKTVTFKIGDHDAAQGAAWEVGGNINLDLSASTSP
jgi:hypothetical protein